MMLRVTDKLAMLRYDVYRLRHDGMWRWVAHKLPERVVYFALMRAYAAVWAGEGNITPDQIDFERNSKWWGRKTHLDSAGAD